MTKYILLGSPMGKRDMVYGEDRVYVRPYTKTQEWLSLM